MHELSVVVFGGTGFIGSHLAARLSQHDMTIVLPARHPPKAMHLATLPGVDIVALGERDLHDEAALQRLVAGHDAVINLVGVLHSGRGTPYGPAFRSAHVDLPRRIVDACAAAGVPRYLHMSALGADPHGPSMYQRSKADGDSFLNMFARLQRHLPIVPLASAHARFQPVYVGDVADAFVRALLDPHSAGHVYELGGPQVYTLGELVRLAGYYAGHESKVLALPDALARLQATLFEMLPGTPLMTRDNLPPPAGAGNKVLTAEALGIKLTALEAIAPLYLSPRGGLDVLRARAGR
jgi:uncharacterized protein YbjT (DUF2867 family)